MNPCTSWLPRQKTMPSGNSSALPMFCVASAIAVAVLALAMTAPALEQIAQPQSLESCSAAEGVATSRHALLQLGSQHSWASPKWQPPVLTSLLQSEPQVGAPFPAASFDGMQEWDAPEILAGDVDGLEPAPAIGSSSRSRTLDEGWFSDPPARAGAVLVQRPVLRTFPGPPRADAADWSAAAAGLAVHPEEAPPLQPRAFTPPEQQPLAALEVADTSQDPALLEGDVAAVDGADDISIRPHAGGAPEMVSFGIYGKNFYGLDMNHEAFTIDSVMTLQWSDSRAAKLLPSGQKSLTLSEKDSKSKLWLPDVAITNHNIKGYELISTSVTVNSSGTVTKVERSLSIIKNRYVVTAFPWDTQVLTLKIASATYMLDDVKLVPDKNPDISGVTKNFLDGEGFTLVSAETSEFEEIDGALKKSRGVMAITVHRDIDKYFQSHFVPAILLMTISYAVFWFPFITPFITPRLALSILALLSFTTLTLKTDKMLPPGAPLTWNDVFNQNCQMLMFFTICLNIFAEVTLHQLKRGDLARQINHECKVLWFGMLGSTLIVILGTDWNMLTTASLITKVMLGLGFGAYIFWCGVRINNTAADAH